MRYLILFILLFLISIPSWAIRELDNCTFTVASTIALNSSNTACEVGGTTWTEEQDTCTSTYDANSADYAEPNADLANCILLYSAPTSPTTKNVEIQVDFIDGGTVGGTDVMCIWLGSDTSNYYSVCAVDDSGNAYRLYKRTSAGGSESLATGGAFSNANTDTIIMRVWKGKGVVVYENGTQIMNVADTALSTFTKGGIGCGQIQVAGDDCDTTGQRFDNFSMREFGNRVK